MLNRLLDLRRQRERRLRVQLARIGRQRAAAQQQRHELQTQRRQLQIAWRRHGATDYVLDRPAWQRFRAELADCSLRDHELGERLDALAVELDRLQAVETGLRAQLYKVLTGQQKLQTLLE